MQDVAPSLRLNRMVDAFLNAEALDMSPAYAPFQQRFLADGGLTDETPETILELKGILAEYREWNSKRKSKG